MKYYTGIGSRQTPGPILQLMEAAARKLAGEGWILRSGHAQGADRAFEVGAGGNAMIYLPWANFGLARYKDDPGMPIAGEGVCLLDLWLANYQRLVQLGIRSTRDPKTAIMLLHGRNWAQVLGHDPGLVQPSKFLICWCPEIDGQPQGGTATAVLLAQRHEIPVRNLWHKEHLEAMTQWLQK